MSISQKFASSSFWVVIGNAANNLVSFLIFVVLARLLDASTIGLVAFALIFIDLSRIVVFGGLPEAIVQRPHWNDDVASVSFTANLLVAIIFFVLMAVFAAPLVATYYVPAAGPVLSTLAAICVIDAARAIHEAKLRREFRYKPLAARMSVSTAVSGVIGIWLAIDGYGVWSLVAQRLVNAVSLTLLSWQAARWTPRLMLSPAILRDLSGFILHLTPARLLTLLTSKVPEFMVGLILGPAAIAFFRVGARGLEVISQMTVTPIQQTALSAFSRLPNVAAIGNAYAQVTRVSAILACPVYLGAAVLAPDFISIVFGPKWAPSGSIMTALALAVGAGSLAQFMQPALTAANRPKLVLLSTAVSFGATASTALFAVSSGALIVAIANTGLQYFLLPFRMRLLSVALHMHWRKPVAGVAPALFAAAAMAAAVHALRVFVLDETPLVSKLALSTFAGIILYPALLILFARRYLLQLATEVAPLLPTRLAKLLTLGNISPGSGQ